MWRHDHPTKAQRRVLSGSVASIPKHYKLVDGTDCIITIRPRVGTFRMPNERTRDVRAGYHEDPAAADAHDFPLYDREYLGY